jgi:hypothetical protein
MINLNSPLADDKLPRETQLQYIYFNTSAISSNGNEDIGASIQNQITIGVSNAVLVDTHRETGSPPFYTIRIQKDLEVSEIQTEATRYVEFQK